jgi:hypothetical protein
MLTDALNKQIAERDGQISQLVDERTQRFTAVESSISKINDAHYATEDALNAVAVEIKDLLAAVGVDGQKIQALADALAAIKIEEKDPSVPNWAKQPNPPTVFTPKLWQFTMNAATAGSVTDTALLPFDTLAYSYPTNDADVVLNASTKVITVQPGTYQCVVSLMTTGATGSTPTVTTLRRKVGASAWTKTKMINVGQNASIISVPFFVRYTEAYEVGISCDGGTLTWNTLAPQARLMITRLA